VGRDIYEHIVVQHNVSCEQVSAAGGIIVEIQDYARLPLANELVDGCGFAAEQELMVPVQINPVCVAARAAGATVGVCLRDNRQLNGWKPGGHLLGRGSEQALEGEARIPLVAMLSGQNQDFQRSARVAALKAED